MCLDVQLRSFVYRCAAVNPEGSVWNLAQETIDTNPFAQLGVAAIVCALLFAFAWTLWKAHLKGDQDREKELAETRAQKDALYKERIEREQYLSDRLAPLLADAVKILALVPDGQRSSNEELKRIVGRLEETVRDIGRR